jgi:hypothetical protein
MRNSTRNDTEAFAVLDFPVVPPSLNDILDVQTQVRAVGDGNTSEAMIRAEFATTVPLLLSAS